MKRRHRHEFYGPARVPTPTAALPGTDEKIAVLEARAKRGECLFDPLDAQWSPTAVLAFIGRKTPSRAAEPVREAIVNEVLERPRLVCCVCQQEKPLKRLGMCSRCYRRRKAA